MNRLKTFLLGGVLIITALITSQCTLPAKTIDEFSVYILHPRNGAILTVGEYGTISGVIYDAGDPVERVNRMIFYANGRKITESTLTVAASYYAGHTVVDWTPEESGEFFLQVSGSRQGRLAISPAVQVCVLDISLESPALYDVGGYSGTQGYEGACEIPARSADARPGTLTFSAVSLPESLTYFPGWWSPSSGGYYFTDDPPPVGCGDQPTAISFVASAGDPNDDIAFIKVDVSYDYHRHIISSTQILNPMAGATLDSKTFDGVSYFPRLFTASELNESFEVIWTAYAIGRSSEVLASDGPYTIPVNPCILEEMVPLSVPLLPDVLPEFIPSVETCPPGSYFDQGPNGGRCIDILIPDLGGGEGEGGEAEGGGDGNDPNEGVCSLSIAICSAQGLSFDSNTCTCVPIQ